MSRPVVGTLLLALLSGCTQTPSRDLPTEPGQSGGTPTVGGPQQAPTSAGTRPNIVFILTDDQEAASTSVMANLNNLIAAQGATFSKFYYSLSLCCPSRTTMLRGQYPHNHGIHSNFLPNGGWRKANALGLETSTIATWLNAAGYNTSYIGKYLNEYNLAPAGYIPPGWTDWHAFYSTPLYSNYKLNENGIVVSYGSGAAAYSTDVFSARAVQFINSQAGATKPFFLWVAPNAPHGPSVPAARHLNTFSAVPLPQPPNFNEVDVSDKPRWVRNNPLLTPAEISTRTTLHRRRLETLLAADEMIKAIVDALDATGQLDNTYIVFTSDNGFHIGQHRLVRDRNSAYEEDILGPLFVRGPGVPAGLVLDHLVLNNDLAPTFAEIGAAIVPGFVDGRSFLPLLSGSGSPASAWRQNFAVEYDADPQPVTEKIPPEFFALRTRQFTYIEYVTAERELYDNLVDPWQVTNIVATAPTQLLSALSAQLAAVRACTGLTCTAVENTAVTVPTPPNQSPVAWITVPAGGASLVHGAPIGFVGSGTDPEDGALTGAALVWTSSRDGPLGTGTGFSTSSLSVGTHTITLTVQDSQSATGTATLSLTITPGPPPNQLPTAAITSPSAGASNPPGTTVDFSGSGTDPEDGALTGAALVWTSSRDGLLGTGTGFSTSSLSVGTHTITLTAQDSQSAAGTATLSLTITPIPPPNQPPIANFTWACATGVPHQCTFDAGSSSDDVGIVLWTWTWGNGRGDSKTWQFNKNFWAKAGPYTVTLTVKDSGGLTGFISKVVLVP